MNLATSMVRNPKRKKNDKNETVDQKPLNKMSEIHNTIFTRRISPNN